MINQSIRNIALSGLMTLLVIGLVVHLAGQTVVPVLAQDGGTATSTPEASPSATTTPVTDMATITICAIDAETGESVCTQTTEPISEDDVVRSGSTSGQDGASGSASPSLSLTVGSKSLTVGGTTSLKMKGSNLSSRYQYTLKVSRSSTSALTGFQNCDNHSYSYQAPRSGFSSLSKTITLYACAAGSQTITAELQRPGSGSGGENDVIVVDRRSVTVTVSAATSTPTATPTPSSTSTPTPTSTPAPTPTSGVTYPSRPPAPTAPSDLSGTWDTNLVSGHYPKGRSYGYQRTVIGSVSSNTFQYDGETYTVQHLRWREANDGRVEFTLGECLKKSAFISLKIGDTTFRTSDYDRYTDAQCESDSSRDQIFTFNTSTNPLPKGEQQRVRLTLKGDASDPSTPETMLIAVGSRYASANESVTLRTFPISGATYRWQKESSSGSWLSASSLSTSTIEVSSPRGTQKYKVIATLRSAETIESRPAYVTWDEIGILTDLTKALVSNVTSTRAYTNAESALRQCVNSAAGTTYQNLDDILSNYHGTSKTTFDSSCSTQLTTMFSTLETELRSKLQNLISSNAEYRQLLAADHYSNFAQYVGDADVLKRNAWKLASEEARISNANSDGGVGGTSGTPPPDTRPNLPCLPERKPTSTQGKIDVLNCLTTNAKYSFWKEQVSNPTLKIAIRQKSSHYKEWMGFENWDCSFFPDAPLPACLKHDVSWDSLRSFEEEPGEENNIGIDQAWSPRNKYFADELFYFDIKEHGCQNSSWIARQLLCAGGFVDNLIGIELFMIRMDLIRHDTTLAAAMQVGVRFINPNYLEWVYTQYDLEHIDANPKFTVYNIPSVPKDGVSVTSPLTGTYRVSWTYNAGTVRSAAVNEYHLCWGANVNDVDREQCREVSGATLSDSFTPTTGRDRRQRGLNSIAIQPNNAIPYFPGRKYPPTTFIPPLLPE